MSTQVTHLDYLIRSGRGTEAADILKSIRPSEVAIEMRQDFSAIAHRLQLPILAIQFLKTVVRDHREKKKPASPSQIITYVKPLIRLGFYFEAENWVRTLDVAHYPEVNDLLARISMAQWDYQKATFYLKRYRSKIQDGTYSFNISTLNYSASLIDIDRIDEAVELLTKLVKNKENSENRLLLGNAHELLAQARLKQGLWLDAEKHLRQGGKLLGHSQSKFQFLIEKWSFARDLFEKGPSDSLIDRRDELKRQATSDMFWEGVRDIDKLWAEVSGDVGLAKKLFYGTIHEAYRQNIEAKIPIEMGHSYLRSLGEADRPDPQIFSLSSGFEKGSLLFNLFHCLNHDFYRPLSMGYLFHKLYPGEYFDPDSSPRRLYRGVERLNQELLTLQSPLHCQWLGGTAQLVASGLCQVQVPRRREIHSREFWEIQRFRELFGQNWFSRNQLCLKMNLKKRKAQNLIQKSRNQYSMEQEGQGPSVRYRFCG